MSFGHREGYTEKLLYKWFHDFWKKQIRGGKLAFWRQTDQGSNPSSAPDILGVGTWASHLTLMGPRSLLGEVGVASLPLLGPVSKTDLLHGLCSTHGQLTFKVEPASPPSAGASSCSTLPFPQWPTCHPSFQVPFLSHFLSKDQRSHRPMHPGV